MALFPCNIGSSGGTTLTVKRLISSSSTTQTVSSGIKIGDYLTLGSATIKTITGAEYVSALSDSGQYTEYMYRATSTSITVTASSTSQIRWLNVIHI